MRMLALHNALQHEGNINMTHRQGGGIPHAWWLTKHEMFMLSLYGRVCGWARSWKTRDPENPHAAPPTVPCIPASQRDREGGCHPLTKDMDIEQDATLTFHQHLSSAPLFLTLPLCSSDMVLAFPWAVAHSQRAGGSATSWRQSHTVTAERAKWAEEEMHLSAASVWEQSLRLPTSTLGSSPLTASECTLSPSSYGPALMLCLMISAECVKVTLKQQITH